MTPLARQVSNIKEIRYLGVEVHNPLSPQRKTESVSFRFFCFTAASKVPTFVSGCKVKKHKRSARALVFLCRTPLNGIMAIIPLSPQRKTESVSFRFFLFYSASKVSTFVSDGKQKKQSPIRATVFRCRIPTNGINEVNPFISTKTRI